MVPAFASIIFHLRFTGMLQQLSNQSVDRDFWEFTDSLFQF